MSSQPLVCQLWMGGLEPYMTESFIMSAFQRMGEAPQNVKVMRNKFTGEPAGYCFVHFVTDEAALNAMHKLSGKVIPNTNPPIRFKLNHASTTGRPPIDREFSLWVGDLSSDVDDYILYRTFASRYPSVRTAKVIMDNAGFSKGYGFIRFASEDEQKNCMLTMNGYKGLGSKAIKISNAVPKAHRLQATSESEMFSSTAATTGGYSSSQDYTQYYDVSYWQNYSAWQGYYDTTAVGDTGTQMTQNVQDNTQEGYANSTVQSTEEVGNVEDDLELVDHNVPLDIERLNRDITERDYNLWDALESSKWLPVEAFENA